jgi:DNA-binding response OmpR family regulator
MKIKVLVVEDDLDLGHLLKQYLELNDFQVGRVFNGEEARKELTQNEYDILILDVMMPREDGFVLADKLSRSHPDLPFLFITARKSKEDIMFGLKLGADDYITKPFDADELILRIRNILKRASKKREPILEHIQIGIYDFQPRSLLLSSSKSKITMTEKEAQLLHYLYLHKDELIKREDILGHLWEDVNFFNGRSMDVFISRLRKYLVEDTSIQIESLRGVGYRFNTSSSE